MAYNNGFPVNYPQYYYPQQVPPQPQTQAVQNAGMIWIQGGEAAAKAYLVAPNTSVPLWDSEEQVIYLKSADASGMPTIKVLDYTIRDGQNQTKTDTPEYALKSDIDDLRREVEALQKRSYERRKRYESSVRSDD